MFCFVHLLYISSIPATLTHTHPVMPLVCRRFYSLLQVLWHLNNEYNFISIVKSAERGLFFTVFFIFIFLQSMTGYACRLFYVWV